MSIKFDGLDNILDSLDKIGDTANFIPALKKACAVVERAAKQKADKNTGELRRSITSKVENTGAEIVGTVYTPLEYAPYKEYGTGLFAENNNGRKDVPWNYQDDKGEWHSTSGMPPEPFMRPALAESREKVVEILREGLK